MAAPKVFVTYTRKDREITERLVDDLQQAGAELWMDVDAIRSGNFVQAIDKALVQCDWLLLVLSPNAIASDYVPEETYTALHRVKQGYMKGVIPVLVASCIPGSIPPQWDVLQRYDASQDYAAALAGVVGGVGLIPLGRTVPKAGYETANYFRRLADLGFTAHSKYGIEYILPPMCIVPAGPFLMGSDPNRDKQAWADEMPQHTVTLPTYEIARFPVTVAEFACFVRVRHRNPDNPSELNENDWYWLKQLSKLDHPVVDVTWDNAVAYATWLADMTGEFWRPPTRAECQKAARGTDGRIYPWGIRSITHGATRAKAESKPRPQ